MNESLIESQYDIARDRYAQLGVDADAALDRAAKIPVSMHCWQADDVVGFETKPDGLSGGGIMATGNHPGRARNGDEARSDYDQVLGMVPGPLRLNLHASYAETGGTFVDRHEMTADHFKQWMDWGESRKTPLDFNPTFFAHPKAEDGYTLSHPDAGIRSFWIEHGIASRKITQAFAKRQGKPSIVNHWIPDGEKDYPADRWGCRARLVESLDAMLSSETGVDTEQCLDFVESKLFGLASEEYVVGSAEFYSSYALSRNTGLCMDMGHYHPTETITDKISALLQFHKTLLLHVSRPMRWDSDHVVIFNDDLRSLFLELARGNAWDRVFLATDFFDASINRIAAYVIGLRSTRKAILYALLDPTRKLQTLEEQGNRASRLALMTEMLTEPLGAVWNMFCLRHGKPTDGEWQPVIEQYTQKVLSARTTPVQNRV